MSVGLRSLLAATDLSDGGAAAVGRAAALARTLGARLHLLHVVEEAVLRRVGSQAGDPDATARLVLDEARRQLEELASGLAAPVASEVLLGSLPGAILATALGHDLLVLGAHGMRPAREALLGTTAERILLKAQQPILVVKGDAGRPYRDVVVPCEYAPPARRALELALAIAPEARITALYVHEPELEGRTWRLSAQGREKVAIAQEASMARARAWIDNLARDLPGAERVSPLVVSGSAARLVPAMSEKADLVVMGKQGRTMLGDVFLGSVTRRTLSEASCDVLVAPARPEPGAAAGEDEPPQR